VTNKAQDYCSFDHIVDTGTLGSAITHARAAAEVDTGHTFTISSNSYSNVGTHTISVTPQSAKGVTITGFESTFTVTVIDPCEDGQLTIALTNPAGAITQIIGD
jgi:hypothetical protein